MASLPGEFNDFKAAQEKKFTIMGQAELKIDAACHIAVVPSKDNSVRVQIDADSNDLGNFDVAQKGNEVSIHQKGNSGSVGSIGIGAGVRISMGEISGGNISIIGGRIFVDGREIKPGQNGEEVVTKAPRIIIAAPERSNLDAKMSGSSSLYSAVNFDVAYVSLSGRVHATLAAKTVEANGSGKVKADITVHGGDLDVGLSGQGSVNARGEFSRVKVGLSGLGSVQTTGTVHGNYIAGASGSGNITHRGEIKGRIRQEKSGLARISLD